MSVQGVDVDAAARRVWRDGVEIRMSNKEFDLLHALISRAGEIVTREELMRKQRERAHAAATEAERKTHYMKCPKDGYDLASSQYHGVTIETCPQCGSPLVMRFEQIWATGEPGLSATVLGL